MGRARGAFGSAGPSELGRCNKIDKIDIKIYFIYLYIYISVYIYTSLTNAHPAHAGAGGGGAGRARGARGRAGRRPPSPVHTVHHHPQPPKPKPSTEAARVTPSHHSSSSVLLSSLELSDAQSLYPPISAGQTLPSVRTSNPSSLLYYSRA